MYRIRPVDQYRIRHVDMYRIRPVDLYRMGHVDMYRIRPTDMYRVRCILKSFADLSLNACI